ncbi:MAG TPA: Chromate resistance protein ChrB [Chloroflexota bacterium]|nr:Chromate resistance protein ChrB [Chloroflexota bacterium]
MSSDSLTRPPADGWLLLVYRVPSEPSNNRVSVWRELKRMGVLYLQQCVCIVPAFPSCLAGIDALVKKIESIGGSYDLFRVRELGSDEEARLLDGFRQLSTKEYDELIEECQTKFMKEIEFERFRENFTYEEAEEIREDLEKIRRWYDRVVERDWFDAGKREEVAAELQRCERMLEEFEEEVYRRAGQDQTVQR